MKKITLVFSLLMALFTTAIAQESIVLSTGAFDGVWNDKDEYSKWTSDNGVFIVVTDANNTEVASMKYHSGNFRLGIGSEMATPLEYKITVPEGYVLNEMKFKNGARTYNMTVYYGSRYDLKNVTSEQTIEFTGDNTSFKLYGETGRFIYITSLTMTKAGGEDETGIDEVAAETEQVIYDLTGRRVDEITKAGIYIVNGKKIVVR